MAHIVILGAGIGGMPMAYEMKALARAEDTVTVISDSPKFHFVPSNPWVAVDWRKRGDIEVDIEPALAKKGIKTIIQAAKRVHPADNQIELADGSMVDYDYLVIATGPKLAFDEIEGLGPHGGHTQSVCHVAHAETAKQAWDRFVQDPGPIVVGAVQGASCFGPAYEFAMIMDTDLRKRKIRDQVPMTYVTPEPYIGHLGLGGVGDSKGMLEAAMRQRHIKWICNAKTTKIEAGQMFVTEHNDQGAADQGACAALQALDDAARLQGGRRGLRHRRPDQPARLHHRRRTPAQQDLPEHLQHRRVHRHSARGNHTDSLRHAQDRLHDRVHGDRHRTQHPGAHGRSGAHPQGDLEHRVPGRLRRHRRLLRGTASDSAPQCELVCRGQMGAPGQGRLREVLHAQDAEGLLRADLREAHHELHRHHQAQGQTRRIKAKP